LNRRSAIRLNERISRRMKKFIIKFIVTLFSGPLMNLYFSTIRVRVWRKDYMNELRRNNQTFIILLWHENMILPLYVNRHAKIHVLVSQHFDGEIISRVLHAVGYRTVRGSSTRGGFGAFLKMKKKLERYDVGITPDGPRGPRRKVKLGAVKLASEAGNVILPVGVACSRFMRLKSWDQFFLILPFSRCEVVYGKPYRVPVKTESLKLRSHAHNLEKILNQLDDLAQECLDR